MSYARELEVDLNDAALEMRSINSSLSIFLTCLCALMIHLPMVKPNL